MREGWATKVPRLGRKTRSSVDGWCTGYTSVIGQNNGLFECWTGSIPGKSPSPTVPYWPDVASSVLGSVFENPTAPLDLTRVEMDRPAHPEIVVIGVVGRGPVPVAANVDERVPRRQGGVGLAEVQQAGLFSLSGFDSAQMGHMLNAYCPNVLFPFAREELASLIGKGGFPPLLLNPFNFDALYLQRLQQQAQQTQPNTPAH